MGKKRNSTEPVATDTEKKQVKMDNFARVLPKRMDKALKAIRMVGDCTLPSYSYTTEQAECVMHALQEAVTTVMERFTDKPGKSSGFKFLS